MLYILGDILKTMDKVTLTYFMDVEHSLDHICIMSPCDDEPYLQILIYLQIYNNTKM